MLQICYNTDRINVYNKYINIYPCNIFSSGSNGKSSFLFYCSFTFDVFALMLIPEDERMDDLYFRKFCEVHCSGSFSVVYIFKIC